MPKGQVNPGREAGVRLGDVLEQVRESVLSLAACCSTTLRIVNLIVTIFQFLSYKGGRCTPRIFPRSH